MCFVITSYGKRFVDTSIGYIDFRINKWINFTLNGTYYSYQIGGIRDYVNHGVCVGLNNVSFTCDAFVSFFNYIFLKHSIVLFEYGILGLTESRDTNNTSYYDISEVWDAV